MKKSVFVSRWIIEELMVFFFFLEGEREIYQRDERINQSAIMVKDSVLLRASKLESRVS